MRDEDAIRELVDTWMQASEAGDINTIMGLMTDDVIFTTPGAEPFDKEAFRAAAESTRDFHFEGSSDIQEIRVLGDWAWIRNRIDMTVTPPDGAPVHRAGYTLSILRKGPDGRWRIARDANLLTTC